MFQKIKIGERFFIVAVSGALLLFSIFLIAREYFFNRAPERVPEKTVAEQIPRNGMPN